MGAILCDFFKHSPVFRIGGDEFVVILQGRDYRARNEILKKISSQIEANTKNNKVVFAFGLAEFEKNKDQSFFEVFKRADNLMYSHKVKIKESVSQK